LKTTEVNKTASNFRSQKVQNTPCPTEWAGSLKSLLVTLFTFRQLMIVLTETSTVKRKIQETNFTAQNYQSPKPVHSFELVDRSLNIKQNLLIPNDEN
jgi:hypothetical protein